MLYTSSAPTTKKSAKRTGRRTLLSIQYTPLRKSFYFFTFLPGLAAPANGAITLPPDTLVVAPIAPSVGFDIEAGACVPFFIFHLPRSYAAPPIDASNDAISGLPCGPPAAGAAPPGVSILGCEAEAGAIPATGG